jgi:YfiH family protein
MDRDVTIEHELLTAVDHVRYAFFTRRGGVSGGLYQSLNCGLGSADAPLLVRENRARCAARLGVEPNRLITAYQVHSPTVVTVTEPWEPGAGPHADGIVTACRGLALGILTADCVPVLFADRQAGVIGAAHAGWKGAKAGIVEATLSAMAKLGGAPERIVAVIGPAIGLASYEVGEEFRQAFRESHPGSEPFFAPGPAGRPHFDLPGFVADRLAALGLAAVGRIETDTCAEPDRFFSYRRACLSGETDYGRQLSAIALA